MIIRVKLVYEMKANHLTCNMGNSFHHVESILFGENEEKNGRDCYEIWSLLFVRLSLYDCQN